MARCHRPYCSLQNPRQRIFASIHETSVSRKERNGLRGLALMLANMRFPSGSSCASLALIWSFLFVDIVLELQQDVIIVIFTAECTNTHNSKGKGKGKAVPLQAWTGPEGSRKLRFPDFVTTAQDDGKVVSLTHRPPLPPGNAPGTHFC